jgi:hypothetical protein
LAANVREIAVRVDAQQETTSDPAARSRYLPPSPSVCDTVIYRTLRARWPMKFRWLCVSDGGFRKTVCGLLLFSGIAMLR